MHAGFFPLYGGQTAFYLQCALRQPNEVSLNKSSSSILHTTTANKRQREERSGAEATNELALREVVVASSGSNVTPVEKVGEGGGGDLQDVHVIPAPQKGEAK